MSFSFPTPHYERVPKITPRRAATVGVAAVGLALETAATYRSTRRLDDHADVVSTQREGDASIYVLPGCRTDGRFLSRALEPHFQELGSTHYMVYPQKGFSLDAVRDTLLDAREKDSETPARFYVLSMGGIVLSSLLRDAEFRDKMGTIDTVVFDSSPIGAHTLTPSTRRAMRSAVTIPHSWSVSRAYSYAMQRRAQRIAITAPHADLIREHAATTAKTPLHAVSGQAYLIDHARFQDGELHESGAAIRTMAYVSARTDDVADPYTSVAEFERVYARPIKHVIDAARPTPSHAAGPEYPWMAQHLLAGESVSEHVTMSYIPPLVA